MTKASSAATVVVANDDWVAAAMTNDQMVAELLLRLKQGATAVADNLKVILPPFRWGVRKRRSRSSRFAVVGVSAAGGPLRKEADSVRGSPVTPLSWSGGCSASPSSAATADGFEGTSRQTSCSTSAGSGSKAFHANEITSSFSKRSKRKKTFPELKDEENFLLKERLNLEKEIANMRTTIKEQNARNENLKRIKLDLKSDCVRISIQDDLISKPKLEKDLKPISLRNHQTCLVKKEEEISDGGFFLLPDLNMIPSEGDVSMETLYGKS